MISKILTKKGGAKKKSKTNEKKKVVKKTKTKSKGKAKVTKKTKSKSKSKVVKKSKGRKKVQKGGDNVKVRVDFELVNESTDYNISKYEDIKFKCLGVLKDRFGPSYDAPPTPFVINSEYILTGPKFPLDHGDLKKEYKLSNRVNII